MRNTNLAPGEKIKNLGRFRNLSQWSINDQCANWRVEVAHQGCLREDCGQPQVEIQGRATVR